MTQASTCSWYTFLLGGSVRVAEYHICLIFKYSQCWWPLGHVLKMTILYKNTITRIKYTAKVFIATYCSIDQETRK